MRHVRARRHAVLVHLTADTRAVVTATLTAAFLGAIVAYIGSARQQRKQAQRDAQVQREQAAHDARIRDLRPPLRSCSLPHRMFSLAYARSGRHTSAVRRSAITSGFWRSCDTRFQSRLTGVI